VSIFNIIKDAFGVNDFKNVRIEKITRNDKAIEINTDTVWFEEHNIEDCIKATEKLGIEHLHLQTHTIDFLADPRLKKVNGLRIQFQVTNIEPIFSLKHLTHLSLPDNIQIEFDFSRLKNLIFWVAHSLRSM
jgi:hypothetical protein